MLENLRQANRLSEEEEKQIDNKLLIIVAAVAVAVIIYFVWTSNFVFARTLAATILLSFPIFSS